MIKSLCLLAAFVATTCFLSPACHTAPKSGEDRTELIQKADAVVAKVHAQNGDLARFCRDSVGYAVFPSVGKGAAGVGGAYGKGVLYEGGRVVGYCDMTQATVGAQIGGQKYTEIICFQDQKSLEHFKDEKLAFDAQASAVAGKSGAAANASYSDGVAVFTLDEKGLMAEASIGGQKFSFQPA